MPLETVLLRDTDAGLLKDNAKTLRIINNGDEVILCIGYEYALDGDIEFHLAASMSIKVDQLVLALISFGALDLNE